MSDFVVTARVRADARQFRAEMQNAERTTKRLGGAAKLTGRPLGKMGGEAKTAGRRFNQLSSGSERLRSSFTGLRTAVAALGLGLVARQVVQTNAEFQRLSAAMETVTGSAAAAQRAMAWMDEFSTKTPFQLEEIIDGFIKLKARGLEPNERVMTSLGDTASAMGKSLDQMIEAVADAVTGENERLKEFGIKANVAGDKVAFTYRGVTAEVENTAEAIQKYLVKLGETHNLGAMVKQMDTLGGAFSNLGVATSRWQRALGDAGFNTALQGLVERLSDITNAGHATAQALGGPLGMALGTAGNATLTVLPWLVRLGGVIAAGRIGALAYGLAMGLLTRRYQGFIPSVTKATVAQAAFRRSLRLLGGPVGAAVAAGTALTWLASSFSGVKKAAEDTDLDRMIEQLEGIAKQVPKAQGEILAAARRQVKEYDKEIEKMNERIQTLRGKLANDPSLSLYKYGGGEELRRLKKMTEEEAQAREDRAKLAKYTAAAEGGHAKAEEQRQAKQSKQAAETIANLAREIEYRQRLSAVLGDGKAAVRLVEAQIEADKLIDQAGSKVSEEQAGKITEAVMRLAQLKWAWEDAKEAAKRHTEATAEIREKMLEQLPVYERLKAEAEAWRGEQLAGLDATKAGYHDFAAQIDEVYGGMLVEARQKDLESATNWQAGVVRGLQQVSKEARDMAAQTEKAVMDMARGMEDGFFDIVTGAKSGSDAFRSFADSVLRDIMRMTVRQSITGPLSGVLGSVISGAFGGFFGGGAAAPNAQTIMGETIGAAKGRAFAGGEELTKFARGGVVKRSTMFRHSKGLGVMGEAGPEAIMPLTRLPGGRLGVEARGGAPNVNINIPSVNIRVNAEGAAKGVEELIAQKLAEVMPNILRQAVGGAMNAVEAAANKGGNFARVVGRR